VEVHEGDVYRFAFPTRVGMNRLSSR
jgi:hypothetical protein